MPPRPVAALVVKRAVDVALASVLLLALAPLLLVLVGLIRAESAGAPVFAHVRVGRGGRPFRCFKLRTMRRDAETMLWDSPHLLREHRRSDFKLRADPRVTRFGRFLRRASLDELPQLWNVVRGDMSLVGPRPITPDELDRNYAPESAALLLSMRPGISGAWAVSGRSAVGYPARTELELDYVRGWTLGRDARILARTLAVVLRCEGAY